MLIATIIAGMSVVVYLIWVGGKIRAAKQMEDNIKGVGKINDMAFRVDKETQAKIKSDNGTGISRWFPRLPRER